METGLDASAYGLMTAREVLTALSNVSPEQAVRRWPLPTGFLPLDEVIGGGLRAGELVVLGGPTGVGKTILALQMARNVALADSGAHALYICYEHEPEHLLSRLLCLESASFLPLDQALTIKRIDEITMNTAGGVGPIAALQASRRYSAVVEAVLAYADRLHLVRPGRMSTTLSAIEEWTVALGRATEAPLLVVIDYVQKVGTNEPILAEDERMTNVIQGLKSIALDTGARVVAVAAADRTALRSPRIRLSDLRGSSAVQYEADIGLVINNKQAIVSREHLLNDPVKGEQMRGWVVLSVEKNRAGLATVDIEHRLDAPHFCLDPQGQFVRERLIDQHVVMA
ncbi:MAG: DnaB-like helicase C-terminal domain-containing protein [Anaerolineales bacterium]